MNAKIVLSSVLVLLSTSELPGTNAKRGQKLGNWRKVWRLHPTNRGAHTEKKSLKIIVPSKIRYVHHHHTHVVLMKDKKSQKERSPDAKYHHLHYYEDGTGKKNKGVNHHYYIPILPPAAEDEEEDESVAKYTIAHPKNNEVFPKPNYISTRQLPPVYEEPRKYQLYDRTSKESYHPPRSVVEYYETDPYFPVKINQGHATAGSTNMEYEDLMSDYTGRLGFDGGRLFYPKETFYDSNQRFTQIY